jgi:predicted RNase H-like nuclease (RuvC/YqgF family)
VKNLAKEKPMNEHQATINELQVSLMRSQEEVARLRKALQKVENAIIEEGKMPSYHRAVMKRHRMEWGTLHNAIDEALKVLHG